MQIHRLGRTDIEVSRIGLGTVKFGRNQGVKYPAAFELPTDKEIESLLNCAAELGINLLDTAPAYGASEERLGKLLRGNRSQWVIATKAGEEFVNGESYYDFSSRAIRESVDRSLRRMHTDYLDIVLVHSNGDDIHIIEEDHVFSMLEALKQQGKIRAYGMSTKTLEGGKLAVELADVVMVAFNPSYTLERDVIVSAHEKQKGVFIKKALDSGHLKTSVRETMKFIFSEPGVSSVIVGTLNPEHLKENVGALDV